MLMLIYIRIIEKKTCFSIQFVYITNHKTEYCIRNLKYNVSRLVWHTRLRQFLASQDARTVSASSSRLNGGRAKTYNIV